MPGRSFSEGDVVTVYDTPTMGRSDKIRLCQNNSSDVIFQTNVFNQLETIMRTLLNLANSSDENILSETGTPELESNLDVDRLSDRLKADRPLLYMK